MPTDPAAAPADELAAGVMDLVGTPYSLEATGPETWSDVAALSRRVDDLRAGGALTESTMKAYFGTTRFEQIAESNALEGSTLSVGETQLAVVSGVTITGKDPAFSRDAVALARALDRLVELAGVGAPTDLGQVREIHGLILSDLPGSGIFRSVPVRISGSAHRPPPTWEGVMNSMEDWERWSMVNSVVPPVLRAVVLHTWLTHIHPFIDGNGRTARAVLNLELVRAGWPSVIIRRKDRVRYLDALAESDAGGDLSSMVALVKDRAQDALTALERTATKHQGYSHVGVQLRARQTQLVAIWNESVRLLFALIENACTDMFAGVGKVAVRWYYDQGLSVDDLLALHEEDAAGSTWVWRVEISVPALGEMAYLAWVGYRSSALRSASPLGSGPSIFWSVLDTGAGRRHRWKRDDSASPGAAEMSLDLPNIDRWLVRTSDGRVERIPPSELVGRVAEALLAKLP